MKAQKQKFQHDPDNGIYGDCQRTAIACILDMDRDEVPHFYDGGVSAKKAAKATREWLSERGLTLFQVAFHSDTEIDKFLESLDAINPGQHFIWGGKSRNGVNHSVVVSGGEVVCDPSLNDAGIVGPCDDGFYWIDILALDTSAT